MADDVPQGHLAAYRSVVGDAVAGRLLAAATLSNVAQFLGFGALFVLAFERAGDRSIGPGLVLAATAIPSILAGILLGGPLGRRDRRRTLVALHAVAAGVPLLALLDGLVPTVAAAALLSLVLVAIRLVRTPAMAESVHRTQQGPLLAAMTASMNAATVLGLALGSSLTVWLGAGTVPLLLTSSLFVVGALVLARVPLAAPREEVVGTGPLAGMQVIWRDPVLRALFLLVVTVVPMAAAPETLATAISGDALAVGLLMGVAPVATTVAQVWLGPRESLLLDPRWQVGQLALGIPAGLLVAALGPGVGAALAANVLLGMAIGWTVGVQLTFMRRVPSALLGQVTGTMVALIVAFEGVGGLLVGVLADASGVRRAYLGVAVNVAVAIGLFAMGVLRAARAAPGAQDPASRNDGLAVGDG